MRISFCVMFVLMAGISVAQKAKKEKRATGENTQSNLTTPTEPYMEVQKTAPERSKKKGKSAGPTYNSEKEFAERMEANGKTSRRNERMLKTPQYSDPMYFGHKNPPKKHKPNKMKYCKECGIRH